tara:strand:+ start:640 stop:1347 length:708 start_codon:yes stop_codon:yes gene_type:complete
MINLLSEPSKMPCVGFNIPALKSCPSARLALKKFPEDSICLECYALKGFYLFKNVAKALQDRFDFVLKSLRENNGDKFVSEISKQIEKRYFDKHGNKKKLKNIDTSLFRGHDSGDLFSTKYIYLWKRVCEKFPTIRFWFPTREYFRPSQLPALKDLARLPNVCLKPSALIKDIKAPSIKGLDAGTAVYTSQAKAEQDGHFVCPATIDGNEKTCKGNNCKLCFIKGCKKPIAYLAH